ncbi:hypothetical protein [Nocardia sp. NPDC057668]|uniref:hypothetical protein n=1 Tax=Nocardia sp. NPDC057668 TaxID=3346202 RepID=UPI00366F59AB
MTRIIAPTLFCLTATVVASTPAVADPAGAAPAVQVSGTDHGVDYRVELSADKRAAVSTVAAGRFLATWDGQAIVATDADGLELATVPLTYEISGKNLEFAPVIDEDGRRLTLTPKAASPVALRDVNAQQHFFDVVQAHLPAVATGAAIGGAIGFLIGFPAGLFVFDIITVPILTVVGALLGGAIGLQQAGGQPAVDAALAYANSLVPGASQALAPAFEALPPPR